MSLSTRLHLLVSVFDAFTDGTSEITVDGAVAFAETLRRAAEEADEYEAALRMLEAREPSEPETAAILAGLSAGRVVVLPTYKTLMAHGLAENGLTADRRFGEDEGGAA